MPKRDDNSGREGDSMPSKPMRGRAGRDAGRSRFGPGLHGGRRAAVGPPCGRGGADQSASQTAKKLWGTREAIQAHAGRPRCGTAARRCRSNTRKALDLARLVARDAPHQGLVLDCLALDDVVLADAIEEAEGRTLVILRSR